MTIALAILLILLNAVWLFAVVLGLPGTWLIATTTALFAWWRWNPAAGWNDQVIGLPVLIALFVLALLGEVVEFVAGAAGAKRGGASGCGTLAAIGGTLAGGLMGTFLIPLPFVGSLVGACAGAAIATSATEIALGRTVDQAGRAGFGAGVGRLKGTLAKLTIAAGMWVAVTVAAFWP